MKYLLSFCFVFVTFIYFGCSDDNATGAGGDALGGGGTGGVTFTVTTTQGQQGVNFNFSPSTSVTVTQITVSLPAQNFQDVVQGDGTTVYTTQDGFAVGEYTGVQSGQQWTFNVQGKLGNAQGQAYNVNSNLTIP